MSERHMTVHSLRICAAALPLMLLSCEGSAQTVKAVAKLDSPGSVSFATVCDGGESVAGIAGEHDVYVWNVATGARRAVNSGGLDGRVDPGAVACNREALAAGTTHGSVVVWDMTGVERHRMDLKEEVTGLAFSADAKELAVTTGNSPVQAWDVASGSRKWKGTTDFANSYGSRISPDGNLVLAADGDTHVRAYDGKGQLVYTSGIGLLEPFDVSLSADGKSFAAAGAEGTIELHETATGKLLKKSGSCGNPIFVLAMAPAGRVVIGLALDAYTLNPASIAYWNPDSGELRNLPLAAKTIVGIGRGRESLLLVRQETPDKLLIESVD